MKEPAEPGGKARDVTPQGFAVRSLAQEYGGGAFAVQGDVVVFSNYSDQRLYKQTIGGKELNLRLTATIPHFLLPGTLTITPSLPSYFEALSCTLVTIGHLIPIIHVTLSPRASNPECGLY